MIVCEQCGNDDVREFTFYAKRRRVECDHCGDVTKYSDWPEEVDGNETS